MGVWVRSVDSHWFVLEYTPHHYICVLVVSSMYFSLSGYSTILFLMSCVMCSQLVRRSVRPTRFWVTIKSVLGTWRNVGPRVCSPSGIRQDMHGWAPNNVGRKAPNRMGTLWFLSRRCTGAKCTVGHAWRADLVWSNIGFLPIVFFDFFSDNTWYTRKSSKICHLFGECFVFFPYFH